MKSFKLRVVSQVWSNQLGKKKTQINLFFGEGTETFPVSKMQNEDKVVALWGGEKMGNDTHISACSKLDELRLAASP